MGLGGYGVIGVLAQVEAGGLVQRQAADRDEACGVIGSVMGLWGLGVIGVMEVMGSLGSWPRLRQAAWSRARLQTGMKPVGSVIGL